MFGKGIRLFKLLGFEVSIDLSWIVIAALVTWSLAAELFPMFYPDLATSTHWWMGVAGALGLFVSIVVHEFSHSLAARQYGMEMRGIRLFIFGGVTQMDEEPASPAAEFVMAIAGPIASVVIAGASFGAFVLGSAAGWPPAVNGVFGWLAWINAVLVAFNLVPAFPLDGGRVLRAALWWARGNLRWATRLASMAGSTFAFLLMILGVFQLINQNFVAGFWWILLGLFLRGASHMSYRQLLLRQALAGEPVRRHMQTQVRTVSGSVPIDRFVEDYVYRHHHKMFPVTDNGTLLGCITTRQVKDVPRDQWELHEVREVAESCSEQNSVSPEADVLEAFQKMNRNDKSRLLVTRGDSLEGVVSLKDISRLLSLKLEWEEQA